MLAGCFDDGRAVHQMGTQHLVFDLDLVECLKEGIAGDKHLGSDRIRMRVEQAGCGKGATTLFQAQRRILPAYCQRSTNSKVCLVVSAACCLSMSRTSVRSHAQPTFN